MNEIYDQIRAALLASANVNGLRDPANRAEVAAALEALARNASALEDHARVEDDPMQFLARSAARDARDVQREYANGHFDRAAFLLRQITENCVVCHTRLESRDDSTLAAGFVDPSTLDSLPLEPKASLQIATRRFDEALATLESLLESPAVHAAILLGPIADYLVVCIRVKGDFERPLPTLERFAARPDLWTRLRMEVGGWIAALPELHERARRKPGLATARALVEEAQQMSLYPDDRTPLVHLIVASSLLERYIDQHRSRGRDLAEAYYLLGVTEARIGRNYWVTPAPYLLEQAIRLAPKGPFATDAYALLERETLMSYEGSDWEDLPEEDAQRLAELRRLIEGG
jgi:tetratricopeptide (TPR) repeat protein